MDTLTTAILTFFLLFVLEPIFFAILRLFGLYVIVREQEARVYVLFGKVVGAIDKPGLVCPLLWLGPKALIVNWLGSSHKVDMRLCQQYLRSQPVNSEEGAPMGIGIWYEMRVGDPISYLFKNTDPEGSLKANVSSAVIRCLSNQPLSKMLEERHFMSQTVREEVTPQASAWGFKLGSVYIRKVHFRDEGMISQIESKVVNRLKQVTSAIHQDGTNRVNVIAGSAEKKASTEFARAAAIRPDIFGAALKSICQDKDVANALFEALEVKYICDSSAEVTVLPAGRQMLSDLVSSKAV
jgi:regulator of protease activity HflC (stomatin/prohibitin superfamily)